MQSLFRTIILIFLTGIIAVSCGRKDFYSPETYYSQELIDSLMVDVVTYMGKMPRSADNISRHDSIHREYYTEMSQEYQLHKLFVHEDGSHFYYIIRPARHPLGNRRGVGGKFYLDENKQILDFEEIFVTPIANEEDIAALAEKLFMELIESGNVDKYLSDRNIIEWPDDRCHYDFEKKEWRYDVIR